jgi:hypothetical protein
MGFLASDDSPYINAVEPMVGGGPPSAPFGLSVFATSISTGELMNYGLEANTPHTMRRSFHEPSSFPVHCTCDIRA